MRDDIKVCVSARTDFFDKYFTVPESERENVEKFVQDLNALGESCGDTAEFEARFESEGLSKRFNELIPKMTQKAAPVTQEQKEYSKQVAKEMLKEDKGRIAKDLVGDVLDTVELKAESELITQHRESMIESGTLDEYTRASNNIEDAGRAVGFFKRLFGKK